MPCYLKKIPNYIVSEITKKKNIDKLTKQEVKEELKQYLLKGKISPAKYTELINAVDICVEVPGHVHRLQQLKN